MSYLPSDPKLRAIAERLPPQSWAARVAAADEEALRLALALEGVRKGKSRREMLAQVAPDRLYPTMVKRLRKYEEGGRDALIDRRAPLVYGQKVTAEVRAAIRTLANTNPEMHSAELADSLVVAIDVELGASTVREVLRELGLSRPEGRPSGGGGGWRPPSAEEEVEVTPLALAGAELLLGLEEHIGAVRGLTDAVDRHLEALPAFEGEIRDDRAHRDEQGRFLPSYNKAGQRNGEDLGPRFRFVEELRKGKDLGALQVVERSVASRYRKDLTLMLLPVVVGGPRWSELKHWAGRHLEDLTGFAYQPSTLDKYTRELKYSGAASAAGDQVADFWFSQEGPVKDEQTGAVVLYADGTTKPLWTRHYSKSTKVSKTGRVQPATTTLVLCSGAGTPMIYQSYSGGASLPAHVPELLSRWERAGGEGTARRLLVVDRECHATWLLKELDQGGWLFIVPVRRRSAGPKARWEEVGSWVPLDPADPTGPQVREAKLWLQDSKDAGNPLLVRAVCRRTDAEDEGATWATNAPIAEFSGQDVLRLYQARWRRQEHVFRDANGSIGFDAHHGYGKKRILNVAVVDKLERLDGKLRRASNEVETERKRHEDLADCAAEQVAANDKIGALREELLGEIEAHLHTGAGSTAKAKHTMQTLKTVERALVPMGETLEEHRAAHAKSASRIQTLNTRSERLERERERLQGRTEIYTVDVELDEIMTAYKLTFLNLSRLLLGDYLKVDWQVDTLIRAVLTLPGERRRTASTETIRIGYQARDPGAMAAVQRACDRLNDLDLHRGEGPARRRLRFEVEPAPPGGSN